MPWESCSKMAEVGLGNRLRGVRASATSPPPTRLAGGLVVLWTGGKGFGATATRLVVSNGVGWGCRGTTVLNTPFRHSRATKPSRKMVMTMQRAGAGSPDHNFR